MSENRRKLLDASSARDLPSIPLELAGTSLMDAHAIIQALTIALLANFEDEECRCKGSIIPVGQYFCRHERAWAAFKLVGVPSDKRAELKARIRRGEL